MASLVTAIALMVLVALGLPSATTAQSPAIGLISALVGEGVITHAAYTEPAPVRVSDEVFVRDRIETKERSVVRVLFGGRITVTIREQSIVAVTDDPARPRVELEAGKLAFKVHPNGLRPGEVAEIYTPNAVTGIRGSLVIAEVTGTPDQPDSNITVLEASHPITVAPRGSPTQAVSLRPGQMIRVSGHAAHARMTPVRAISRQHAEREALTAEVPGRRRDGGQERGLHAAPREARAERRPPQERQEDGADRGEELHRRRAQHEDRADPPEMGREIGRGRAPVMHRDPRHR